MLRRQLPQQFGNILKVGKTQNSCTLQAQNSCFQLFVVVSSSWGDVVGLVLGSGVSALTESGSMSGIVVDPIVMLLCQRNTNKRITADRLGKIATSSVHRPNLTVKTLRGIVRPRVRLRELSWSMHRRISSSKDHYLGPGAELINHCVKFFGHF